MYNLDAEGATDQELSDYLYNWHCGMCNAFNGTPYPLDHPRGDNINRNYELSGSHLCFTQFEAYCKHRGISK